MSRCLATPMRHKGYSRSSQRGFRSARTANAQDLRMRRPRRFCWIVEDFPERQAVDRWKSYSQRLWASAKPSTRSRTREVERFRSPFHTSTRLGRCLPADNGEFQQCAVRGALLFVAAGEESWEL